MSHRWWSAASFVTWMVGWGLVGGERPVRLTIAMGLVIASGVLGDRGIRMRLDRESAERLAKLLREGRYPKRGRPPSSH